MLLLLPLVSTLSPAKVLALRVLEKLDAPESTRCLVLSLVKEPPCVEGREEEEDDEEDNDEEEDDEAKVERRMLCLAPWPFPCDAVYYMLKSFLNMNTSSI